LVVLKQDDDLRGGDSFVLIHPDDISQVIDHLTAAAKDAYEIRDEMVKDEKGASP
jgi:hypothetical protein